MNNAFIKLWHFSVLRKFSVKLYIVKFHFTVHLHSNTHCAISQEQELWFTIASDVFITVKCLCESEVCEWLQYYDVFQSETEYWMRKNRGRGLILAHPFAISSLQQTDGWRAVSGTAAKLTSSGTRNAIPGGQQIFRFWLKIINLSEEGLENGQNKIKSNLFSSRVTVAPFLQLRWTFDFWLHLLFSWLSIFFNMKTN